MYILSYTKIYERRGSLKKFDPKKLTLTNFNPDAFRAATGKLNLGDKGQAAAAMPSSSSSPHPPADPSGSVPKGRTTLRLNKLRGVVSADQAADHSTAPVYEEQTPARTRSNALPVPPPSGRPDTSKDSWDKRDAGSGLNHDAPPAAEDGPSPSTLPEDSGVAVRSAALKTRASRKSPNAQVDPDTMIMMPTRVPKWLKDVFFKTCRDKNMTPSLVIRNLMKSFCGLCLLFVFTIQAAETSSKTYSTEDIFSFLCSKAYGITSNVPDFKLTASARQSLWNNGQRDSTDYIYLDRSTTRLEARLDIPILDLGYLRDRSRDKVELRSHVMKSLSKILAAQKTTKVLEERASALRARVTYTQNQVNLKLANKNDLFPLEDQYYNVQTQLFESQSTLDQRIVELATVAGADWKEAFTMIQKWDGNLF